MPLVRKSALPPAGYTISNDSTDRAIDVSATTLNELLNVVATMIKDLGGA